MAKMSKGKKVLIGAGAAAVVGGVGYYLWRRYQDGVDFADENDRGIREEVSEVEADSRDNTAIPPSRTTSNVSEDVKWAKLHLPFTDDRAVQRVQIVVDPPRATLHFDEKHYEEHPKSNLRTLFRDGDQVGFERACKILYWPGTNGSVPTQMTFSGSSIPLHVPRFPRSVYVKRIKAGDNSISDLLAKSPKSSIGTTDYVSLGFTELPLSPEIEKTQESKYYNSDRSVVADLPLGAYLVVVPVGNLETTKNVKWKYLKGMWKWTKDGPRTRSCSWQRRRFLSGNCANHITSFARVVRYDSWDDVAFVMEIGPATKKVSVRPGFHIAVGHISYYRNSVSKKYNRVCEAAEKIIDLVPITWIRPLFNKVADVTGC